MRQSATQSALQVHIRCTGSGDAVLETTRRGKPMHSSTKFPVQRKPLSIAVKRDNQKVQGDCLNGSGIAGEPHEGGRKPIIEFH